MIDSVESIQACFTLKEIQEYMFMLEFHTSKLESLHQ